MMGSDGPDSLLYGYGGLLVVRARGEGEGWSKANFDPAAAEEGKPGGRTESRDVQSHGDNGDSALHCYQTRSLHEGLHGASNSKHALRVDED